MRHLTAFFFCLLAALPLPAAAQQNGPIQQTIQLQLDAMAQDDFALAFRYASPTIQDMFGTPAQFEAMVRQGYPMVVAPREVRMLELRTVAGNLWQRVLVVDQNGITHLLDYMMVEAAGGWQINAVQLLPSQGVSA